VANLKLAPRWLLAASGREVLERLLAGAHRSGVTVVPQGSGYSFELVHDDHPRASLTLTLTPILSGSPAAPTAELALTQEHGPRQLLDRVSALIALEPELIPARLDAPTRALTQDRSTNLLNHMRTDSRWQDLFLAHLKQLIESYQWWEPRAWESLSDEGVHEFRVTVRRLRALLKQFAVVLPTERVTPLRRRLRWLGDVLGSARDLDMQLARCPAENAALEPYRLSLAADRRATQLRLLQTLASADALVLPIELHDLAAATRSTEREITVAAAAPRNLETLIARVQVLGHRTLARTSRPRAKDLHQLRLAAKRLRYGLETVAPVIGKPLIQLAEEARSLQEQLGEVRDAESTAQRLSAWRETTLISRATDRAVLRQIEREHSRARKTGKRLRKGWPSFLAKSRARILC
jgi:CHAD domain-containing protein